MLMLDPKKKAVTVLSHVISYLTSQSELLQIWATSRSMLSFFFFFCGKGNSDRIARKEEYHITAICQLEPGRKQPRMEGRNFWGIYHLSLSMLSITIDNTNEVALLHLYNHLLKTFPKAHSPGKLKMEEHNEPKILLS